MISRPGVRKDAKGLAYRRTTHDTTLPVLQAHNKRPLMLDPARTSTARVAIRISRFMSLSILYWRRYILLRFAVLTPIASPPFFPFLCVPRDLSSILLPYLNRTISRPPVKSLKHPRSLATLSATHVARCIDVARIHRPTPFFHLAACYYAPRLLSDRDNKL